MTETELERQRCLKIIKSAIAYNKRMGRVMVANALANLVDRINQKSKSTGRSGGLLSEQLELPFNNLIDANPNP